MGTIERVRLSLGKATDVLNNLKDRFTGIIGKVNGFNGTCFEVVKNGSTFTGINYSAIDTIRGSIRNYVKGIQDELAKINDDLSPDNALKGDIAAAAKAYVRAVTQVADAYVSSLLTYSDKMYEYGEAFKKNESTLSSNVNDEASALSSSVETYTEKY